MNTAFPFSIFRAYDIRGKLQQLTPQILQATGYALADFYQSQQQEQIVIGYDARLTSPAYAHMLAHIFKLRGFTVTLIGCCSSPMLYYIAKQRNGNGIMVTASHNPKSDNGIKWIIQDIPPSPEEIQAVSQTAAQYFQRLETQQFSDLVDYPHEFVTEYCVRYRQSILADVQLKRSMTVVLDAMHGSAGACAVRVLESLGCEVIALRCQPNGHFPEHAPDPSQPKHLRSLQAAVRLHQADLGIALDGDGDRLVVVDEQSRIVSPDQLIALFAKLCLQHHPQHEVVFDVKCSQIVEQAIVTANGQPTMIRTGSSFLRKHILAAKGRAVFGGEYAGHYVFYDGRGQGYDDGLYAACRLIEHLSQAKKRLSSILDAYPTRYATDDLYIATEQIAPALVLAELELQSQHVAARLSKIDGIRLDFQDGFGIVRASNTGEYFTVRFEAASPEQLKWIQQQFISMLEPKYPKIAHDILMAHEGEANAVPA